MTLRDFVAHWVGHYCHVDALPTAECVDLANAWAITGCFRPRLTGNAKDLLRQAPPRLWNRTLNAPYNYPPPGAIVVWEGDVPGQGIGPFGHCAVAVLADELNLVTFDQNWPMGAACSLVLHPYDGVQGWLTPRPNLT